MGIFNNSPVVTGNANTLVAGTVINGPTLFIGESFSKVGYLSALVSVTAATATITFTGKWQVSVDGVTWVDDVPPNNAANVVFTTGTTTIKTANFDAPNGVRSWAYCRFCLTVGVTTGAVGDVYSIGMCWRKRSGLYD